MKYINGIINIAIGLALIGFGFMGLKEYFGGNQQKLERLETLMADGIETMGIVDSMYTETSVAGADVYSSKYTYNVQGKVYSESFYFDNPEELLPFVTIKYMPNDPSISAANLEKQIEKAKKDSDSKVSLFIGIAGLLAGAFLLYFRGIRNFMSAKPKEGSGQNGDELV